MSYGSLPVKINSLRSCRRRKICQIQQLKSISLTLDGDFNRIPSVEMVEGAEL